MAIHNIVHTAGPTGPARSRSRAFAPLADDELVVLGEKLEADIETETCEERRRELVERAETLRALMDIRARVHTRFEAARIATNNSIGRPILDGFTGESVLDD